ncbi:RES domain-containing protein [Rhodococcus fascians]|uniref:RES domain-containing protein n=1 Tax=Rhodococcoides fascians TaxID=1828 RepID=UPI00050CBB7E|nr:RES domain-containing protein [Rhodococcus fascians]AMY54936.1 hypothetical protein A3L23_03616 [Rhodococcus fascians D188]MBY4208909.1 RES domain-containing protein [Rhodococcus fascians]
MNEQHLEHTSHGPIRLRTSEDTEIHRVGYAPDIWAWTPWQYAHDGRFSGRWDDPNGTFRSLYVAGTRLACYLEVLAFARPDLELAASLDDITEESGDEDEHPTLAPGTLPDDWRTQRRIGTANLTGSFAAPADSQSLPTLRARFARLTIKLGLPDLDASAVRLAEPRTLTQAISAWLYTHDAVDGIEFDSRHGDNLTLWALYERAHDDDTTALLAHRSDEPINADDLDMQHAMTIHRIQWAETP